MFKKNKEKESKGLFEDPQTKQLAFFGFYLVFFIIIVILLRTSYKSTPQKSNTNALNGYGYDYKLTMLTNNNFHFIYKENINDFQTIYEGDTLNSVTSFTKSGDVALNYYISDEKTYIKDNNQLTWSETTNPLRFKEFVITKNIQSIINNAEYIYKTEYMKEDNLYFGYKISNNELRKIFKIQEIVGDEETSSIIVFADKNKNIKSISFDLTNYYKKSDPNINKYIISLNYSKFNEIKEITNPIN